MLVSQTWAQCPIGRKVLVLREERALGLPPSAYPARSAAIGGGPALASLVPR